MSPETLLRQFDVMADAPNGVQKLRELILQLAVRGKLVRQDASDEPAEVLVERARNEKLELVRRGEVRERRLLPLSEDAIPYPLPSSWTWARLDDVGRELSQRIPDRCFTYIDVSSIDNARGTISDAVQVLEANDAPSRARKLVRLGSVIYSTIRPYLLNIAVVDRQLTPEPIVSTAFAVLDPLASIEGRYLFYYLRSSCFIEYVQREMTGMVYPAINDAKFFGGPVPVPPVAEQRRIVAKVDELMARCDELETRQQRRAEARARANRSVLHYLTGAGDDAELAAQWQRLRENFGVLYDTPETVAELRQAALQLAVRGRLVPQDPADEPASVLLERVAGERQHLLDEGAIAKTKPLPAVGDDETPFTLPEGWEWTRFGDATRVASGVTKGRNLARRPKMSLPYLRVANVQRGRLDLSAMKDIEIARDELDRYQLVNGDLLMTEGGDWDKVGRAAVWRGELPMCIHQNHVFRARPHRSGPQSPWFELLANSPDGMAYFRSAAKQTTNLASINMTQLRYWPCPIPPSAEQHRILVKVDELMALCDQLEAQLTHARAKSGHLAASVVHRLTAA